MVPASKFFQEMRDAIARGDPVVVSPARFEVITPDAPEQAFLRFDITVASPSFNEEKFALTGQADLQGLGVGLDVSLCFGVTEDNEVSSIAIDVASVPSLQEHPFANLLRQRVPDAAKISLTDVRVDCQLLESTNSSVLGVSVPVSKFGGLELVGGITSRSTTGTTVLQFAILSSDPDGLVWTERAPSGSSFAVDDVADWMSMPRASIPPVFDGWIAQTIGLSWGKEFGTLTVGFAGEKEIFSEPCCVSLSITGVPDAQVGMVWEAGGQLRVPVSDVPDGELVFLFDSAGVGVDATLTVSAVVDGALVRTGLDPLSTLPFMRDLPDLSPCLPNDLVSSIKNVAIDNLSASFRQDSFQVLALGASVTLDVGWEPVPGLLRIDSTKVWFLVGPVETPRRIDAGLEAVGYLGDLALNAVAHFPENLLELHVQNPFDLEGYEPGSEILPPFDDNLEPTQPVALRDLAARCDLSDGSYSLMLGLATDLSSPPWFALTDVWIQTTHAASQSEMSLRARATLAGITGLVAVERRNNAWSIQGELDLPDDKTLAQWVSEEFSITLPDAVSTLELDSLRVSYLASGSYKKLDFLCSGGIELGANPRDFSLNIRHTTTSTDMDAQLVLYLD